MDAVKILALHLRILCLQLVDLSLQWQVLTFDGLRCLTRQPYLAEALSVAAAHPLQHSSPYSCSIIL